MATITEAFERLGLDPELAGTLKATATFSESVDRFTSQQLTPEAAARLTSVVEGVAPAVGQAQVFSGISGDWESVHYAKDLIPHQPKFKFLFKVKFEGFPGGPFERYVVRCDKPKIQLNHQDVNYYNFRTRVLTHVTLSPLSMTLLDEIGDTVHGFFSGYLKKTSDQASGGYGIDTGTGGSSSSKPYEQTGFSSGRKIIIQQIFANGLADNKFKFKNPRIETFDFDELSMEDTNGSLLNITFSYDALECETGNGSPIYTWGETDISMGGGSSNFGNNGGDTGNLNVRGSGPAGIMAGRSPIERYSSLDQVRSNVPIALQDLVNERFIGFPDFSADFISSAESTIDRNARETIGMINNGGGFAEPEGDPVFDFSGPTISISPPLVEPG